MGNGKVAPAPLISICAVAVSENPVRARQRREFLNSGFIIIQSFELIGARREWVNNVGVTFRFELCLGVCPGAGLVDQKPQTMSAKRRVCSADVPGGLLICSVRMKRRLKVNGYKTR